MVSKEDIPLPAVEAVNKRRRRRAGVRVARRRARKMAMIAKATLVANNDAPEGPKKCAVHAFLMRYQSALRRVPAHLPPRISSGPPTKRVKRVSWKEDDSCSGSGGDPAVLAIGPARRPLVYTKEELLRIRTSPLVKGGLETAFAGSETLALVLKKRSDSPNEEDRGAKGDSTNENQKGGYGRDRDRERERGGGERERERERRSADPRERVRKESETSAGGIVLSPQRRSFTSGCGAPAAAAPPPHVARTRPESPLATAPPPITANKPDQGRRIGSGRIMVRDMTTAPWERGAAEEGEYTREREPYRPPNASRDRGDDRFERRSFGRDPYSSDIKRERDERFNSDKARDREENRRTGGGRYGRRYDKEDEPEWFSGGPTSQLETIELRGFDEPIKRNSTTNGKETEKWVSSGGGRSPPTERWRSEQPPAAPSPPARSTPTGTMNDDSNLTANEKDSGVESKAGEDGPLGNEHSDFNLDEFLKFDTIPDVLTNGSAEVEGGSRFSRWFRRESPTHHYERLLHNIVDDLESTNSQPSEPSHLFAPISPAGAPPVQMPPPPSHQPRAPNAPQQPQPPSLLELLQRANAASHQHEVNSGGGKIHSLEELEARLRPQHPAQQPPPPPHPDHDLSAFKRLLAQVSGGHAVTATSEPQQRQPQPMTLLQMLNKSVEQQHKQQQQQQQQQQPPHIPQELLYKLLQVQQRQQQQELQGGVGMGGVNAMSGMGGVGSMSGLPSTAERELLQRPEAQAIIHGLKQGEITVQHLMQQLGNPGLQSRHREVLLTILRLHQQHRQMGGSPLPGGVSSVTNVNTAPHLVVPPHHQPLRLSPLPHPAGVPARIPSPRELAAHTQSIMQNALIKKKLEEQRENYRRRHEQLQQQLPKQATPISFTPTSVLRKMTADKDAEALSPKQQQWIQPPKLPQGRPIVKGNQSGGVPPMGYALSPADYQQHFLNQQQITSGVRSYPHSQQRQQIPPPQLNSLNSLNSINNMNNMSRGVAGGTTLHQLLVQSHQRSLNDMSGGGPGIGGGSGDNNQLARWFSPELLAKASAGKLPSVHVPNALSLEELERAHHSPAVRN